MSRLLAACGGFLLAVLWIDLMFDVQALRPGGTPASDAEVLRSIAGYYRRVTTDAAPMHRLIGAVMAVTVAASAWRAARSRPRRWQHFASVLLAGVPIGLAAVRVFPNAVRLGAAADVPGVQAELAQAILRDHMLCLVAIAVFTAVELRSRV